MPIFRQTSSTGVPTSACFRAKAICSAVKFETQAQFRITERERNDCVCLVICAVTVPNTSNQLAITVCNRLPAHLLLQSLTNSRCLLICCFGGEQDIGDFRCQVVRVTRN